MAIAVPLSVMMGIPMVLADIPPSATGEDADTVHAISARAVSTPKANQQSSPGKADKPQMTMETFLDRLMMAESSGRDYAKNPLSSATGAFQFIDSTFLYVMRRHFPAQVEGKSRAEILALRTDRAIARKAAEAYTRDNAALLAADGHTPTFANLRLAFLLGAGGASRVLDMEPDAPIAPVLGRAVMRANPFMVRMTAADLIARAARDLELRPTSTAGIAGDASRLRGARKRGPRVRVRCNLRRPSCRRWLALKERQLRRAERAKARRASQRAAQSVTR